MRRVLVALVTAALVGVPAVPAVAGMEHCPAGVSDVRGTNPDWRTLNDLLIEAAAVHDVPVAVLKAIAWRESEWTQFTGVNAPVKVSGGTVCALGIMQVNTAGRDDAVKLAQDVEHNIFTGAEILRQKWDVSQQTPPPAGSAPDDDAVLENWYYAICLYNGCSGDDTYARSVAGMVADPFRRVPWYMWKWLRPAGFTMPHEADPTYVFPNAFQARHAPEGGTFVFYDHTTGTVTKTVSAYTHRALVPPVISYPPRATGPDMLDDGWRSTECGACTGWRLAEGAGVSGRAHWTNTVTTAPQSSVTWRNYEAGRFRVSAYVPALGTQTLGKATYRIRPTGDDTKHYAVAIDQNARKGGWVSLGDWTMDGAAKVYLDDGSSVAGQPIVADAVRFVPLATLSLDAYVKPASNYYVGINAVTYGQSHLLGVSLGFRPSSGASAAGRPVRFYRRVAGTTAWQMLGAWNTNANGAVEIATKPLANMEYTARYVSADGGTITADGASGNVRVNVRQLVRASLARTSVRSGDVVTVSSSVAPGHAGQLVYLQRFYSGAWRTVASRQLSSTSTATFSFRFSQPCCQSNAKHLFRVYKPADRDHVLGLSPALTLLMSS